jgi:ribosomal protein S18 acetylase RimI-like enzyme
MTVQPDDFQIRTGQQKDAAAILQLWQDAGLRPTPTDDVDALRVRAAKEDGLFQVAESGGQVIGTIIGGWDGWRGNIYRLAVQPEFRRRGVARALVHSVEKEMQDHGVRRIHVLLVQPDLAEHAVEFWKSMGYEADRQSLPFGRDLG